MLLPKQAFWLSALLGSAYGAPHPNGHHLEDRETACIALGSCPGYETPSVVPIVVASTKASGQSLFYPDAVSVASVGSTSSLTSERYSRMTTEYITSPTSD